MALHNFTTFFIFINASEASLHNFLDIKFIATSRIVNDEISVFFVCDVNNAPFLSERF